MRRHITLFIAVLAVALSGAAQHYDEVFEVEPDAELSLRNGNGTIVVRTHGRSVIEVIATVEHESGGAEIETRSGEDFVSLSVDSRFPDHSTRSGCGDSGLAPRVDWEITVPIDASLDISGGEASFDIEAPGGRVEIRASEAEGSIVGVRSDLDLEIRGGQLQVDVDELHDLDLESQDGELVVVLRNAADFTIEGSSRAGALHFDGIDVPVHTEYGESRVDFTDGSGRHSIEASTHEGVIEIRFE